MAGKSGKYRFILLIITAFAVAGCDPSMGMIGGGLSSSSTYGGLLVDYSRSTYNVGQFFYQTDLKVYAIDHDGGRQILSSSVYEIRIIEDPTRPAVVSPPVTDSGYQFTTSGEKAVQVRYNILSIQYRVDVLPSGSDSNMNSGIVVTWEN